MKKIGFIGLGVMGYPMAGHIQSSGYEVSVFNRTEKKALDWQAEFSGNVSPTVAQLSEDSDYIFLCVGNDEDVRSLVLGEGGVLENIKKNTLIIDHTTTSSKLSIEISNLCQFKNVGYIDAPVSGGEVGAKEGKLTVMCGGNKNDLEKIYEVINCYSKFIKLMGPSGSGQLTKMVNQITITGLIQSLSEAIYFSEKAGLDTDQVIDVISKGAAQSWQMENRWKTMLAGKYDHGFAVDLMRKDLKIAIEEGSLNGASLELTKQIDKFYEEIQSLGGGRWDTSSLLERLKRNE